jgi:hypothetical protein
MNDVTSPITRQRVLTLYPALRAPVYRVLQDVKTMTKRSMHVTDALRSYEDQLACYSKGRAEHEGRWQIVDKKAIVTNARPGMSWHCYGLAFDCAWDGGDPYLDELINKKSPKYDPALFELLWKTYADMLRAHGFRAGADFHLINGVSDRPHGEMTFGLTLADAMELYSHGGNVAVWAYLDKHRGVSPGQDWELAVQNGA